MKPLSKLSIAVSTALLFAPGANAAIYAVGDLFETGCTHENLRDALNSAANNPNGPHLIKVAKTSDSSLSYTGGYPTDSAFVLTNPQADITVEGGYAACADAAPQASAFTTLDYVVESTDDNYSMLAISNAYSNPRRTLTLRRLYFDGGSSGDTGPNYGGAIRAESKVTVRLEYGVDIRYFGADVGGGGVMLTGLLAPSPSDYPILHMSEGADIRYNDTAQYGGGIYAFFANVILAGGAIRTNEAGRNGGGIYAVGASNTPNNHEVQFLDSPDLNLVQENKAAQSDPFSSVKGYGGGIYSSNADIYIYPQSGEDRIGTAFVLNKANFGGAIYVDGPNEPSGGPFTTVRITNGAISINEARGQGGALYSMNAVDWEFDSAGPADHDMGARVGPGMYFKRNKAFDAGNSGYGGGVAYINDQRSDGASRGIMHFYRTWFFENHDAGGASVVATDSAGVMVFRRTIFDGNTSGTGEALLYSPNNKDIRLTYSTIADNETFWLVSMPGATSAELNVQGSILWSPDALTLNPAGGGSIGPTGACLISNENNGPWDTDPQLDERYAPRGSSPAIDYCDSVNFVPMTDVSGFAAHDTPGVAHRFAEWDLGAVEQTDIIYANTFGNRPDN